MKIVIPNPLQFEPGQEVVKVAGYPFRGVVVAAFNTLKGEDRYAVECTVPGCEGLLHIFNASQLGPLK
jgi:hypothetical protein